jgi:uncharacterized SAM-binding protein YcdF (DUF218 family)
MHVLASALLGFLLSPVNWILVLVVMAFIFKNPRVKKTCRLSALIIFIVFTNQWLFNAYARFWNPKPHDVTADKPYSCGIVLGGFGSADENGNGYFNIGADRFIQAIKLYKLGKIKYILISGGNDKEIDTGFEEGAWAKEQMEMIGIPADSIFYEDLSNNTADNAFNAKRILDSVALKPPYLLITSAFHIPRATRIFENAGIPVVGYPCNYLDGMDKYHFWGFIPKPENLFAWNVYLRETAGYFFYYLKGDKRN